MAADIFKSSDNGKAIKSNHLARERNKTKTVIFMNAALTPFAPYGPEHAMVYDQISLLNKGNREGHRSMLEYVLSFLSFHPSSFLDLGCGTGYFSEIFFKAFPEVSGTLLDSSREMLEKASVRFKGLPVKVKYHQVLLQEWPVESDFQQYDIVFSALTIHHLVDEQKWRLFKKIFDQLARGGVFILYDIFRLEDERGQALLEYLACKDMQKRFMAELDMCTEMEELSIDRIIANDRTLRQAEGDQEAYLDKILSQLTTTGFRSVTTFLQEARFASIICFKD
jgi:SAM-dependent methyltransferase